MKENQRVVITKKMLKNSILELLKEKNLNDITVTELCSRAQINRTTFYRYYKIPADVLMEIEKDFVEEMRTTLWGIKTVEDAKRYLTKICEDCYDKTTTLGFFIRYDFGSEQASLLGDLYLNSHNAPDNLSDSSKDTELIVSTYFAGGSYFILRLWVSGKIKCTPAEMADLLWNLMTGDYSVILKNMK
ncbi:MAG: TetR/AcrR family transcriptional regulator [Clostridia bacterium]|nr:TetR/AcrR family transcriptional regulator [Clostridia bacterium]